MKSARSTIWRFNSAIASPICSLDISSGAQSSGTGVGAATQPSGSSVGCAFGSDNVQASGIEAGGAGVDPGTGGGGRFAPIGGVDGMEGRLTRNGRKARTERSPARRESPSRQNPPTP